MLEKMQIEDIGICSKIYLDAFGHTDRVPEKYDLNRYFLNVIKNESAYALVYKEDNEIVGIITAIEMPSLDSDSLIYIDVVAVAPDKQKSGYGKSMLKDFYDNYSNERIVWLVTESDSPGSKLYESVGMVPVNMMKYYCYVPNSYLSEIIDVGVLNAEIQESQRCIERLERLISEIKDKEND